MRLYNILDAITGKLEKMYPVGAIYISTQATDPGNILGFGTWRKIEGRFLVGAGQTGANDFGAMGEIGASAPNFLAGQRGGYTDASLPTHTHEQDSHGHEIGSHTHEIPGHKHTIAAHNHGPGSGTKYITTNGTYAGEVVSSVGGSGYRLFKVQEAASFYAPTVTAANTAGRETDVSEAQRTEATATVTTGVAATNKATGVAAENRNIPPYLAVHMWERIS